MTTITLTTDFGESEIAVAALKGELLSNCKEIIIVDISHKIRVNNIPQAAFMVRCSSPFFPSQSIHCILVGDFETKNQYWLAKVNEQFFITKNFMTLSLLFSSIEKVVLITQIVAAKLFESVQRLLQKEEKLVFNGDMFHQQNKSTFPQPLLIQENGEEKIKGHILYFTVNGNAMTNISQEMLHQMSKPLKIMYVNSKEHSIYEISDQPHKIQDGKLYAHCNDYGLLEIGMKNTSIRQFLGLELISSTVTLIF